MADDRPIGEQIVVRLDDATRAALAHRVAETGRTVAEVVRALIRGEPAGATPPPPADAAALLADVRARVARLEAWRSNVERADDARREYEREQQER